MHACGSARNRRQEGDVLIVSVLIAIVVNLALRSNAQGRIKVPGVRQLPILVGLGASAIAVVGNPEIEDEVPRPSRVLEVVDNLDVATQCCCAGIPMAVKCAVVSGSRWACKNKRRRNSPCMFIRRACVWRCCMYVYYCRTYIKAVRGEEG